MSADSFPTDAVITDVVLAVIQRQKQVLIARRRPGGVFGGWWEFPGGKRQVDETLLHCLAREVKEELGIVVRPGHQFDPIVHAYADKTVRLLAIACQIESSLGDDAAATEPRPLTADCLTWVPAAELRSYRFPPANGPLVEQIIAHIGEAPSLGHQLIFPWGSRYIQRRKGD